MAYCTSANLTFPPLMKGADIASVINSTTREIDNYLRDRGVTGIEGTADLTEAAVQLAKAGIVEWWISHGQYMPAQGGIIEGADPFVSSADISAIQLFRNQAHEILDRYVTSLNSLPPKSIRVSTVRNRMRGA